MPTSPRMSASTGAELPVQIRPARAEDEPAVRGCAEAAYAIYVPRMGRRPAPMDADFARQIDAGHVHVLEVGREIVGYVVFYERGDHVHLENIAVSPEHKGRGFGGMLLRHVEQQARATGVTAIELYTNARMTENLQLYPRLGYVETGRRTEDGFSRVYFRKTVG